MCPVILRQEDSVLTRQALGHQAVKQAAKHASLRTATNDAPCSAVGALYRQRHDPVFQEGGRQFDAFLGCSQFLELPDAVSVIHSVECLFKI